MKPVLFAILFLAAASAAAATKRPKLPDRWWDVPSCPTQFQQTATPLVSTVRLNSTESIQWYRIVWLKIQRRLNGIKVEGPYVVPCRNNCVIGPGEQVEIWIDPADFPDVQVYEEADRRELGCVPVDPPKKKQKT